MKAIRINPYSQEVEELTVFDLNSNQGVYELLSTPDHPIDCYERVLVGPGHYAYIDESGGLPHHNPTHFWKLPTTPWIAGMGLILGETSDREDWADCIVDGEIVIKFILMKTLEEMNAADLPENNFSVIGFDTAEELFDYLEKQSGDSDGD